MNIHLDSSKLNHMASKACAYRQLRCHPYLTAWGVAAAILALIVGAYSLMPEDSGLYAQGPVNSATEQMAPADDMNIRTFYDDMEMDTFHSMLTDLITG